MPRKGPAAKRPVIVDPVYGSPVVTQLVNKILLDGKKSTAERIVYGALEGCREKTGNDPVITLKRALTDGPTRVEVGVKFARDSGTVMGFGASGSACFSSVSRCAVSLWRKTRLAWPEWRTLSIIEAWFSSSENRMQPGRMRPMVLSVASLEM